jgi:molybdopterin-containing oxidoreductase family membrane subunit
MTACNVLVPQFFWFRRFRRSIPFVLFAAAAVNVGMWFERFVIIVTSLSRDYLPSAWGVYAPTWVDLLTLLGSFGLFFTLFLLFLRFLPIVAMAEVKSVMPEARLDHGVHRGQGDYHGDIPRQHERQFGGLEAER